MLSQLSAYGSPKLSDLGIKLTPCGAESELLKSCDAALGKCAAANEAKQEVIDSQTRLLAQQTVEIKEMQDANNSVLKSPILWGVIGAAAAALILGVAR